MIIDRVTGECYEHRRKCPHVVRQARQEGCKPHYRVQMVPVGESKTRQAAKDQTDINNIVDRYTRNGQLPETRQGVYADVRHLQGDRFEQQQYAEDTMAKAKGFQEDYDKKKAEKAKAAVAAQPGTDEVPKID